MSESLSDSASPEVQQESTLDDKPYHSKRPHKKSRAGCKNCKARKVKCDEARPTCRSCRLRKTECLYPAPSASVPAATTKSSTVSNASNSASPDWNRSSSSSSNDFSSDGNGIYRNGYGNSNEGYDFDPKEAQDMAVSVVKEPQYMPAAATDQLDMRLLWFYTTATCSSFSVECGYHRPVETVMRTRLVQHAFQTPFLMQSLFALSALHLQNLDQTIDPNRALAYRATSFEGYRKAVEEGNPETFPALIANSLLLTALSSQAFRDPDGKDLYIIDWMIVWRGIGLMMNYMGSDKLLSTGLHTLFYRPPLDLERSTYAIPSQLLFMVSSITEDDPEYEDVQTYYDTCKYIGALYYNLNEGGINPIMNLRIITWLTFIPRGFVELGRQKRDRALVILAYYAVFLKMANRIWWIKGIGHRTLKDICRHLGPEWSHALRVPMLAINIDEPCDLGKLVLEDPEWLSPAWPAPEDETLNAAISELSWVDNTGQPCIPTPTGTKLKKQTFPGEEPVWTL